MAYDLTTLDAPFAALKAFDWGADAAAFQPIDAAVIAAHTDADLRAALESRFALLLADDSSRAAKEYVCRKLAMIGTAASVPGLAALLPNPTHSHMARFALERIDAPAAGDALREALPKVDRTLKIGMISSLASRKDQASVPLLAALLIGDAAVAAAAAEGLGTIATAQAAAALASRDGTGPVADALTDARLACAEALLAGGDPAAAKAIYVAIEKSVGQDPKSHRGRAVRIAATRGLLASSRK